MNVSDFLLKSWSTPPCLYIISVCFIIRLLPHVGPNHPPDDFHILSLLHILTLTISDENRDKRILNFSFLGWPFSRCWAAAGTCVFCIGSALSSVRLDGYIMGFRLGCRHIRFFFFFDGFPFAHEIIIDLWILDTEERYAPYRRLFVFSFLLSVHGHFNSFGSGLFFCIFLH